MPSLVVTNAYPASASAPAGSAAPLAAAPRRAPPDTELLQAVQAATSLLKAYRTHGHLAARLDPLGKEPKGDPAIEPENLNLTPELMAQIPASILRIGVEGETLLEALPRMREAYCGTIAYQIEHLSSHQQRMWLREMIETGAHRVPLTAEEKRALLSRLIEVFQFERFLQKRLPRPEDVLDRGPRRGRPDDRRAGRRWPAADGAEEVVLGMAHRGRLAVLAHNLGRPVESIMAEFEGAQGARAGQGDRGDPARRAPATSSTTTAPRALFTTPDGEQIKVRLYPNPSHLEFVDPVVTGGRARRADRRTRARARARPASSRSRCCSTATRRSRARAWSPRRSTSSR